MSRLFLIDVSDHSFRLNPQVLRQGVRDIRHDFAPNALDQFELIPPA